MAGNSFGTIFRLTTFGESHGEAVGGIIDGCPSGLEVDISFVQAELDRRKPGQSNIVSQRKESDTIKFLSGLVEGTTTGAPLGFIVMNTNQKPSDYDHINNVYRPSHADYTYDAKYGVRDYKGGGRSSARETISRVVAGAIAKLILKAHNIQIAAYTSQIGPIQIDTLSAVPPFQQIESNPVRCPEAAKAQAMIAYIEQIRKEGDTTGGVVTCHITGVPAGLGEPVFDKLQADLAKAMLSINAAKGFEYGSGFEGTKMKGSAHNDPFEIKAGKVQTTTNHSGGIQGGISNGENIYFRVAFKPVSTIMQTQDTIDQDLKAVATQGKGRHDPCVVPRAVPIVEAMAALVMVDQLLRNKATRMK